MSKKFNQAEEVDLEDPLHNFVRLNKMEERRIFGGSPSPISTVTWLETSTTLDDACKVLKNRVEQILMENPACAGTLVKTKEKACYIKYPTKLAVESVIDTVFRRLSEDESTIHEGMDIVAQGEQCKESQFLLKQRLEFERPGWLVSVVPSTKNPSKRFAVIVCSSHVYYDGAAHYLLYNMLMGMEPIRPLVADRKREELAGARKGYQSEMKGWVTGFMLAWIGGILTRPFYNLYDSLFKSKEQRQITRYCMVDPVKIKAAKELYKETKKDSMPDYVSTNDIVSSWFLSTVPCRYGIMSIDMRNKVEGITKDQIGSHTQVIPYRCPPDVDNPGLIRQSLPDLKRAVTSGEPFKAWDTAMSNHSIVSNWSSFASPNPLDVKDCQQLIHFPVPFEGAAPSIITCLIFEPRQGQLALLLTTGGSSLLESTKSQPAPFESPFELENFLE